MADPEEHAVEAPPRPARRVAWMGVLLKVLKSGKVLKIALAGVALSGWTVIYSWQFAVTLTATIMFHEYGHLRAMRRFGIPTKGMYLIPFVGGIAVGERAKSHWQDVYIAMMGPVFGLLMSSTFYVIYRVTDSHLAGLVASLGALVNVFNLLPIMPLDGGRVVKALVFSSRSRWAFLVLLASSAALFALVAATGLYLICFFIVLGVLDLLASWRDRATDPKPPLDGYGIGFSTLWYLLTVAAFAVIILLVAGTGLPGSEIATHVLKS